MPKQDTSEQPSKTSTKSARAYIGIDPGLNGGIALIQPDMPIIYWPMPVYKQGTKKVLNIREINEIFSACKIGLDGELEVYIERVHAMPKQGVVSVFTFGEGYGVLKGVAIAHGFGLVEVRPTEWQSALLQGVPKDLGKQRSIVYCQQRFPEIGKLSDGIADAICIGLYGSQR